MRNAVRGWLISAGAVAAAGAMAFGQAGPASAARTTTVAREVRSAPATYVPPGHDLYYGDHGAAVKSVQKRLNQLHYYAGPNDGAYGDDLEEAVWAFKEVQGLPMNATSNSIITYAFRKALVHPRQPYSRYPEGRRRPHRGQPEHPGAGAVPGQQAAPHPAHLLWRPLLLLQRRQLRLRDTLLHLY